MKNYLKRTVAAAAAAVMTLGLVGCGENTSSTSNGTSYGNIGGDSAASNASGAASNTDSAASTADSTAADSGAASDTNGGTNSTPAGNGGTLVIGGIGPITGGAAIYGENVKKGAQLAIDEINAAGGVNGMTLELNFQDDEHDPEKSVTAYNAPKDKGMKLLIGTVTSGPCEAVSKEATKDNMFLFTPSGSSVNAITSGDNCFRMCFNDPQQGKLEADFIAEKLDGKKKVGAIYDSSDSYSTGILDGFKEEAAAKGLEVVAEEAFTSDSNKDFSVQIQKMIDNGAEVLFLPIYYTETALILQQAEGKLDVPVVGGDGLDGLINALGDKVSLADGVYALTPYSATAKNEKAVKFTEAFQAKYPDADAPIQFAADAYDCVYALKAALEKAEINDANIDASELCDKLKTAMVDMDEYDGVTGKSKWTADGEVTKDPKVMQIKVTDGKGAFTDI